MSQSEYDPITEPDAFAELVRAQLREFGERQEVGGRNFAYIELDSRRLLYLEEALAESTFEICTGFPFPLESRRLTSIWDQARPIKASLYMYGQVLRDKQFAELRSHLLGKVQWKEHGVAGNAQRLSFTSDELTFVDLFDFVGDSISLLKVFSHLADHMPHQRARYLTNNGAVAGCFGFEKLSLDRICASTGSSTKAVIVIANFIDSHWSMTCKLICEIVSRVLDAVILVLGSSIVLTGVRGTWLAEKIHPDVTIHSQSVEQQFAAACLAFGFPAPPASLRLRRPLSRRALINPFARDPRKTLPLECIREFALAWNNYVGSSAKLLVIAGPHVTVESIERFLTPLTTTGIDFAILRPASVADLTEAIASCDLVYSCDSAPVHIAERLGTPCVATYNASRWDPFSVVSTFHHSPFGFAPSSPFHISMVSAWTRSMGRILPQESEFQSAIRALLDGPDQGQLRMARAALEDPTTPDLSSHPENWFRRWWPIHEMDSATTGMSIAVRLQVADLARRLSPAAKFLHLETGT